jgi:demethylmenaquinone methyltransferase/2-methoxy-6-polyprenyl-1,4-benzoquinol methylase
MNEGRTRAAVSLLYARFSKTSQPSTRHGDQQPFPYNRPTMPAADTQPPAPAPLWDDQSLKSPHAAADKRQRVQRMFAAIAPSYDLNNRLHSLWMDQAWRRKAVKLADLKPTDNVIDVACGTADLSIAFRDALLKVGTSPRCVPPVVAIDFTFQMLPLGRRKAYIPVPVGVADDRDPLATTVDCISFINGDAQSLPLPDACADVVSIAFGIRNVADPAAAIREFHRVLRPGGRLVILEFSLPTNPLLRTLYNFYFRKILPRTATWISRDKTGAYKYLPESVNTFITRERMSDMMTTAGFANVTQYPMTFGVCVCYRGEKTTSETRGVKT